MISGSIEPVEVNIFSVHILVEDRIGRQFHGQWYPRNAVWESKGQEVPGEKVKDSKGGKHRDEQWRPMGGGEVQLYGLSVPRRFEGGGEA